MKTAVIVINYNNPADTDKCLESLASHAPETKVVVVDNASTKGDIDEVCGKYSNVHLIKSETNLGFGRANNLGIRWAMKETVAEYLFILNNDAYIKDDAVARLEDYLDSNAHMDVASPRIMLAHQPDVFWYGGGGLDWKRGGGRSWRINREFDGETAPVEVTLVTGCAMMLRRSILESVGGFDPRFFIYYEDVELSARIVASGGRLSYVPSAVVYHRTHGSIRSSSEGFYTTESHLNPRLYFFLENTVCNVLLTFDKYAVGADRVLGAAFLAAKWTRDILRYTLGGRVGSFTAVARGVLSFIRLRNEPFLNELSDAP